MPEVQKTAEVVYPVMTFSLFPERGNGIVLSDAQVKHIADVEAWRKEIAKRQRGLKFKSASSRREWRTSAGESWSYVVLDDAYVRIEGYSGSSSSVQVPAQIEGKDVVVLAADALARNDSLEEVVCPDCIEGIGAGAFRNNPNLRRLVLPAHVADFEASWVAQCPSLEELVLPGMLEEIERGVLAGDRLSKLVIGCCVSKVEPGAFQGSRLVELAVDESNPFISTDGVALYTKGGDEMIALACPVKSLVVAPGCVKIAKKCCHGFVDLEQVELPASVVEIGPFAFSGTGMRRFEAPSGLTSIGEKAFFHCGNLKDVALNDGLEEIGESAFEGSAITALAIPATIAHIGRSITRATGVVHSGPECSLTIDGRCREVFLDGAGGLYRRYEDGPHLVQLVDSDMERYDVFDGAVAIDPYAFANHDSIAFVSVPASVTSIGRSAFRICKKLKKVELPDTMTSIGAEAFFDTALEEFRVPAGLRELGDRALVTRGAHHGGAIPSLARVEVAPGNGSFYTACGMLCRRTEAGASVVVFTSSEARVVFPDEVTRVEEYAFNNARGIEYLAINARLSSIGTNGFTTSCWIRHIHVDLPEPLEGRTAYDFFFPDTPGAVRGIANGLGGASWVNIPGIVEQLDICLINARDYNTPSNPGNISAYQQARLILDRFDDPVMLTQMNRDMMRRVLRNHIASICVDAALHDDRSMFDELIDRGFVNADNLDMIIDRVTSLRDAASSAHLLEAKRVRFARNAFDYDL